MKFQNAIMEGERERSTHTPPQILLSPSSETSLNMLGACDSEKEKSDGAWFDVRVLLDVGDAPVVAEKPLVPNILAACDKVSDPGLLARLLFINSLKGVGLTPTL
mmetsp:Transcript_33024/g.48490  ORF Transcript_33024/g.48490 Transcript_33024/m.48490 type:complete len:105 (+) Transcript_33024:132-446(+)